ncbi:MAG TPA: restriction endonuclease, partial [Myxococcota bacterium]|nr:restriction endonuclease [Myxococcota bacterium]
RVAQAHWSDFSSGRAQGAEAGALSARFVVDLLREAFGFVTLLPTAPVQLGDRFFSVGHLALSGRLPIVIAPAAAGLDSLSPAFADGGRRRSAFGLCQEFLNAADHALWGLCSDGLNLRLLRDNASLTRPTWIEADLSRIFVEERYADFAALWLLIHESRFGRPEQPAADSPLEAWRTAGRDEGTPARAELRKGVEEALLSLGNGFLAHPDNGALRSALQTGALRDRDFFAQLLRLVYRLIFLLTVEERDLLHPASTSPAVRDLYARGYSLRRLSDRSARRSAHDRHSDAWLGLTIVLRGLSSGEDRLGLPALAGLFDPSQCPNLDGSSLENRAFFLALFRLTWLR